MLSSLLCLAGSACHLCDFVVLLPRREPLEAVFTPPGSEEVVVEFLKVLVDELVCDAQADADEGDGHGDSGEG